MSIENKGWECLGKRKTVFVWGNSSNKHRLAMIWKIEKYLNWGAVPNYRNEKPIFFSNHSNNPISDELFLQLRACPNVLITGHQSFLTNEALSGIANTTIANLDAWHKGEAAKNELWCRRFRLGKSLYFYYFHGLPFYYGRRQKTTARTTTLENCRYPSWEDGCRRFSRLYPRIYFLQILKRKNARLCHHYFKAKYY